MPSHKAGVRQAARKLAPHTQKPGYPAHSQHGRPHPVPHVHAAVHAKQGIGRRFLVKRDAAAAVTPLLDAGAVCSLFKDADAPLWAAAAALANRVVECGGAAYRPRVLCSMHKLLIEARLWRRPPGERARFDGRAFFARHALTLSSILGPAGNIGGDRGAER